MLDADNYTSAISKVETLGFHRLDQADEIHFNSVFAILGILSVTPPIIDPAVALRQQRRLTLGDALIAATALEYRLDLATRSVSDFTSVPGLTVYNPFIP